MESMTKGCFSFEGGACIYRNIHNINLELNLAITALLLNTNPINASSDYVRDDSFLRIHICCVDSISSHEARQV